MKNILLEVRDLKKYYSTPRGMLHAVDGVSFSIQKVAPSVLLVNLDAERQLQDELFYV